MQTTSQLIGHTVLDRSNLTGNAFLELNGTQSGALMERKGNAKWNAKGTQNGMLRERKRTLPERIPNFWGSCSRNYGGELTLVNTLGQNNKRDHLSSSPFAAKGINKFVKFIDDYLRKTHVNATKFYHENIPIFILMYMYMYDQKMFY